MTNQFEGKVALVTGGSRSIGAAIAKRLAKEGAAVALTYVKGKEGADAVVAEIQAAGGKALAIQADSADAHAVAEAVESTVRSLGGLDILVNNAGILAFGPVDELTIEDFDRTIDVNVKAVFVAVKAAVPHLKRGGRIITIGSTNAERMPFVGGSVYAMSKAAVAGLTRGLARDLGPRGITVNTIQPGPVDTDMNPADGPFSDMMKGLMALDRYARSEEIAGMVAYLASEESGFVTGASLMIDGGFSS